MEYSFSTPQLSRSWKLKVSQANGGGGGRGGEGLAGRGGRWEQRPGGGGWEVWAAEDSERWGVLGWAEQGRRETEANTVDICQTGIWPCLMYLVKSPGGGRGLGVHGKWDGAGRQHA